MALERKPRLVAVGYASNALGTVNPVATITQMAHDAGVLVYIAVQYAPHGPIDVQKMDCDFLVCSSNNFFGPHTGVLNGKYDLLDSLTAYKVRPAPQDLSIQSITKTILAYPSFLEVVKKAVRRYFTQQASTDSRNVSYVEVEGYVC